jgi:hypothetical protein
MLVQTSEAHHVPLRELRLLVSRPPARVGVGRQPPAGDETLDGVRVHV